MPVYSRYISIGQESTYGIAATTTVRLDIASESLELKKDIELVETSRFMAPTRSFSARRVVQGTVDAYFGFEKLATVLRWLVGAPFTTNPAVGVYSHLFAAQVQVLPPSLTIAVPREQQLHRYTGCFFTQARLSIAGPEHFGLALSVLGADEALASIPSALDADFEEPIWTLDPATATPFSVGLGAEPSFYLIPISALDLDLSWDRSLRLSPRSAVATGFVQRGSVACKGRVRWVYGADTAVFYDAYRNDVDSGLSVGWFGPQIGATGQYRTAQVSIPLARLVGRTPTVRGPGYGNIDHEIPFEALDEGVYASPLNFTVLNTTAVP